MGLTGKALTETQPSQIRLNNCGPATIYNGVRHFRNMFFVLTAFLWLPASAHCQLESIPGLEFLRCPVAAAETQHPAKDCCDGCAGEHSQYRADHVRLMAPAPELLPIFSAPTMAEVSALPNDISQGIRTAAPPQILQTRHFAARTALPARAPSIAS